jgi:CBS-domain-containing membrane protein
VTEKDLQKIYGLALRYPRERITLRTSGKDMMTRNVITVKRTADLPEGLRILSDKISGIPVADGENRVIGVISGADSLSSPAWTGNAHFRTFCVDCSGSPCPLGKPGAGPRAS